MPSPAITRTHRIAAVLGMELVTTRAGRSPPSSSTPSGEIQGVQTKNQLDPTEEPLYVPGDTRRLFEIDGVKFGMAICHEGLRYPETVRWAAVRGAKIVFHPHSRAATGPASA